MYLVDWMGARSVLLTLLAALRGVRWGLASCVWSCFWVLFLIDGLLFLVGFETGAGIWAVGFLEEREERWEGELAISIRSCWVWFRP